MANPIDWEFRLNRDNPELMDFEFRGLAPEDLLLVFSRDAADAIISQMGEYLDEQ